MELLRQHCAIQEAEHLAALLRSRGIVIFISNKQTHVTGSFTTGANSVSLWVVLKNQFDDAEALINNEEHNVTTGLNENEFKILEKQVQNFKSSTLDGLYHIVAGAVLIAVVVGGIVFGFHTWLG